MGRKELQAAAEKSGSLSKAMEKACQVPVSNETNGGVQLEWFTQKPKRKHCDQWNSSEGRSNESSSQVQHSLLQRF